MKKVYNKIIANKIFELIENDSYTVEQICKMVGISKQSFYNWKEKYVYFFDGIKKARNKFDEKIVQEAEHSLLKKIKGFDVEEKTTEVEIEKNGEARPAKIKTTTKHIPPDTAAIIFTLTNREPSRYQNKYNAELSGKNGKDLIPEPITIRIIDEKEQLQNGSIDDKNISGG